MQRRRHLIFYALLAAVVLLSLETIRMHEMARMHRSHTLGKRTAAFASGRAGGDRHNGLAATDGGTPLLSGGDAVVYHGAVEGRVHLADVGHGSGEDPEHETGRNEARPTNRVKQSRAAPPLDILVASTRNGTTDRVCPLPVLHPWKWREKMTWGIRKPFVACEAVPSKHVASFSTIDDAESSSVTMDPIGCPQGGLVLGFEELDDGQLPRLQTVMDAEMRQNELKARYASDDTYAFASQRLPIGAATAWKAAGVHAPYVLVLCGMPPPVGVVVGKELHIRSRIRSSRRKRHSAKVHQNEASAPMAEDAQRGEGGGAGTPLRIKNVLHVMFDSTSIQAFRRSAPHTTDWLHRMHREPGRASSVFTFKHYHSVSCCSPGNQVPMYAGVINGEGDRFVESEPLRDSSDWLWNVADSLGFTTFWSLDNCPDKSARDYHATPSVDSRVVAPLCLAGVLLSHKERECIGGRTVDEHVYAGLRSFWANHHTERKFAAVQFITPHEETEKQILELDIVTAKFFAELDALGVWNDTALVFWSDHGINFGKYATTHDGEFEKLFPFVHVVLPRWLVDEAAPKWGEVLRANEERLVSPYDFYEVSRALLHWPKAPPSFHGSRDRNNPRLPLPSESHIMASFQKPLTPVNLLEEIVPWDRDCAAANIPIEFCTCVPWRLIAAANDARWYTLGTFYLDVVLKQHRVLIGNVSTASGYRSGLCTPLQAVHLESIELQEWPTSYKPREQPVSKRVWMMPNRDMLRIAYRHTQTNALFQATISVSKERPRDIFDVAKLDRVDAMTRKCGVVDKVSEQLCECVASS